MIKTIIKAFVESIIMPKNLQKEVKKVHLQINKEEQMLLRRMQILLESLHIFYNTKNFKTFASRYRIIGDHLYFMVEHKDNPHFKDFCQHAINLFNKDYPDKVLSDEIILYFTNPALFNESNGHVYDRIYFEKFNGK